MRIMEKHIYRNHRINFNDYSIQLLTEKLQEISLSKKGMINVALSGGNTPLPILKGLKRGNLDWERFNFFMVDERCVPLNDSSSNFGNIQEIFFKDIPSESFSMVNEGYSYLDCASQYAQILKENIEECRGEIPVFDLVLLGLGDDGHTASLFPGTTGLSEISKIVVLNKVPQLSTERITLTFPVLLNAKEVVVIVKGVSKEKIIKELYSEDSPKYPMLKVVEECKNLKWIIGE